jgi:hypothetical protein
MSGYKKRAVAPLAPRDALTASLVACNPTAATVLSRARAVLAALRSNAATSPHARWTQARATGTKALQTLCNAWIEYCRSGETAAASTTNKAAAFAAMLWRLTIYLCAISAFMQPNLCG